MDVSVFLYNLIKAMTMRRTRLRSIRKASRSKILALQRRRLAHLLEHAAKKSSFYRRRWNSRVPQPEDLSLLDPLDKTTLIEHFDEVLTVKDLNLEDTRKWLNGKQDALPKGYIFAATSGTTGQPLVIPYRLNEWREGMAYIIRSAELAIEGTWGRGSSILSQLSLLLERPRIAGVSTLNPVHVSAQLTKSFRTGIVPNLLLSAGTPLEQQLAELNRFKPTVLGGYPSAIAPLVKAAEKNELRISPELIITGGETLSQALRRQVRKVWDLELFDYYGLAETLVIAGECHRHQGLHIYEDAVILEVVDEHGGSLPPGKTGHSVLLTCLFNKTLPVIRYDVGDILSVSEEPCACGTPLKRIVSLEGRRDELLVLRGKDGQPVDVHPIVFESALLGMAEIRQFQIDSLAGKKVLLTIVPHERAGDPVSKALSALTEALAPLGIGPDVIRVRTATEIKTRRGPTDKLLMRT